MLNKFVTGVLVVAVLAFGGYALLKPTPVNTPVDETPTAGAVGGPDLYSPYFNVNGVYHEYRAQKFNNASTTVCAAQSPKYATSTLLTHSVSIITGTTTALVLEISRSISPSASTTMLSRANVASGKQITLLAGKGLVATSTDSVLGTLGVSHTADEAEIILAPGTWITTKYGGPHGSANSLRGFCNTEFFVNSF